MVSKIGWKYVISIEDTGIDNGFGATGELLTYGDDVDECIKNAGMIYFGNDAEPPTHGPAEEMLTKLSDDDKRRAVEFILNEIAFIDAEGGENV